MWANQHMLQVLLLVDLDYSWYFLEGAAEVGLPVHVIGMDAFAGSVERFELRSARWVPEEAFHAEQIRPLLGSLMRERRIAPAELTVVTLRERSVKMAAELAEGTGCQGIGTRTATLFRDKWEMVHAASRLGVPVPDTRLALEAWGAETFPAGGVMLKPRRGSVSLGLHECADYSSLEASVRALKQADTYIAQAFIEGPMYFADAVMRHGKIRCLMLGKHVVPLGQVGRRPGSFTRSWALAWPDVGLSSADAPLEALVRHHETVVRGFGLVDGCTHVEFFVHRGAPLFCEAAARAGGPRIMALQRSLWGMTMPGMFAMLLGNKDVALPAPRHPVVGMVDFVCEGPVAEHRLTRELDAGWILKTHDWDPAAVRGGRYTDPLKRVLIAAPDPAVCEGRLAWLADGFEYRLRDPAAS